MAKTVSEDPAIHYELAMIYAYTGFIEEGFHELAKIPQIDKDYAKKVLQKYERRSNRYPFNWEYHFYYAFALYFNNDKKKALIEFNKSATLSKEDSIKGWSYGYMAYIYGEQKEWRKALETINIAISYEPNGAALYFALGLAKKELGDKVGAAAAMLKASTLQARQLLGKRSLRNLRDEK